MRMKKIMILAVAAIALAACAKTYDKVETAPAPIGFNTWTEQLTKVRTQGSSTFASGDDFAVYGYKEVTDPASKTTVFDDIDVNYDGTNWAYDHVRFWDQATDSYTFYAVSPTAVGTAATVTPQTGVIASASITFAGNDNDILVADEKTVAKANYGEDVALVFNHIASLVDFKVKKHSNLGSATLAITSFSLTNMDKTGTFAVDSYTSTHPDVEWTASAHNGTYTNTSGVTSVATLPTAVGTTGDFLINNLVAMPQTFRYENYDADEDPSNDYIQTVSIAYTITDEASNVSTYTASFNLKLFDDVDDTDNEDTIIGGWEAGKHYTFYITIDAQKIVFTASITPWTPESGYNYLVK